MSARDLRGRVSGSIVHDQNFEVRVVELASVFEALVDGCLRVVCANHDAHRRPLGSHVSDVGLVPSLGDLERWFGAAVDACQAEVPVVYWTSTHDPRVGPRKDTATCDASLHRHLELPIQAL